MTVAGMGSLRLVAYPTEYAQRIRTIPEAADHVRRAEVSLRGWNFPHTDRESSGAFGDGVESWTRSKGFREIREAYRLYRSGLFVWSCALREDAGGLKSESGKPALSFVEVIYSFTEHLMFCARLYEAIAPDSSVRIEIVLDGCKGRELSAFDAWVAWSPGKISSEDTISVVETVRVVELRASYAEIALRIARHVFHVFNWLDVQDQVISVWQQKLLKRQF